MRVNGHGNRSTRSRRDSHRNRCTGTATGPGLQTISAHVTRLLAAQAQTRKRTASGQVTGFLTNRTDDGMTSMKDTYREISHRHRRWDRTSKGHLKTTSTISHGREFTEETWTNRVDNTKTFKNGLDIIIEYFKWKVTYEHKTDGLIGSGDWNRDVAKEESGSLKEIVPVLSSLARHTDSTVLQELDSCNPFHIKGSQQLWGNFRYSFISVDLSREM